MNMLEKMMQENDINYVKESDSEHDYYTIDDIGGDIYYYHNKGYEFYYSNTYVMVREDDPMLKEMMYTYLTDDPSVFVDMVNDWELYNEVQ